MVIARIGIIVAISTVSACFGQEPVKTPDSTAFAPTTCDAKTLRTEAEQLSSQIAIMQSRIVTLRVNAGSIQSFEVRNALQVDAELWQQTVAFLKHYAERLNREAAACTSGKKSE